MTVIVYAEGPMAASVCAPSDMPREKVAQQTNAKSPTGISSPWQFSQDETFKGGQPNPCPCEQDPTRTHYLMEC